MKKTIAFVLISIFVFSLVPSVFAQLRDRVDESVDRGVRDVREDVRDSGPGKKGVGVGSPGVGVKKGVGVGSPGVGVKGGLGLDRRRGDIDVLRNNPGLDKNQIAKIAKLDRATLKRLGKLDAKRINAELKAVKVVKLRNVRDLADRRITDANLAQLRQRYGVAKEKYQVARAGMISARSDLRSAVASGDPEAVLSASKDYLTAAADSLINHLEKVKTQAQQNENIAESELATIVSQIDAEIAAINTIKTQIGAAATKEEVKAAAKALQEEWKKLRELARLHASNVVSARVEGIVNEGTVLERRLDRILEKLEQSNIDVDVSAEVETFSGQIATAKDKRSQAQAKLAEARQLVASGTPASSEEVKALVKEANQLLKEARDSIKAAHATLRSIVKKIKEASPSTDVSEETEVEVTEEPEVEVEDSSSTETSGESGDTQAETPSTDTSEGTIDTGTVTEESSDISDSSQSATSIEQTDTDLSGAIE
ncbi:hypothetical protein J4234_00685 [Candidatus Woesearchaeota archaeon]|nr:hypothetical protein [Candidatus Woesearchaeota archaeon]